MSLLDTVRSGVETAFAASADFVSVGTYTRRSGAPVMDPVTDTLVVSTQTLPSVRMLRSSLLSEEREASQITVTDVKVLIPGADLPGVVPSESDVFVLDGTHYNVLSFKPVPGNALWIVFGREA